MRLLVVAFFSLCIIAFFAESVLAQGHSAFCGQADSTAASQECLKRHLDSAQKRLNNVYLKLTNSLEGKSLEKLKDLQTTWLRYRDAECMWEAERSVTAPLKRVNELSCMARVTEDRVDLLTIALNDGGEEGAQREYGSFPRWMNVVAKDNPDVYWAYGKRASYDLDCDGEEEYVMQGFTTKRQKVPKPEGDENLEPEPENLNFEKNAVVAIAQNPPTGRPTAQIFTFPVLDAESPESVCTDALSLEYVQEQADKKDKDTEKEEQSESVCSAVLKIKNKGCAPKIIAWTGKEFSLQQDKEQKQ